MACFNRAKTSLQTKLLITFLNTDLVGVLQPIYEQKTIHIDDCNDQFPGQP